MDIIGGTVLKAEGWKKENIHTECGSDEIINAEGLLVLPGFIDLHTHGACGIDVNHADAEGLKQISRFFATQGVTGWQCSILTDTKEQTLRCIRQARQVIEAQARQGNCDRHEPRDNRHGCDSRDNHDSCHSRDTQTSDGIGAQLLGIHLEGPCLSRDYAGAMPHHLLHDHVDIDLFCQYQEAAGGHITYVTLAPELPGAVEAIPKLNQLGIAVALGHSGASYEETMVALKAGACSATHLGNAMALFHQHRPSVFGALLASDAYCEAICDGIHLHPGAVNMFCKAKTSDKMIAVTDSIMAAGMADGIYQLGVNQVTVQDGDAKLADGTRAGSTLTMIQALRNIIQFTGLSLEEAAKWTSKNPAAMMGWRKGQIASGFDADYVILSRDLQVIHTVIGGRLAYSMAFTMA